MSAAALWAEVKQDLRDWWARLVTIAEVVDVGDGTVTIQEAGKSEPQTIIRAKNVRMKTGDNVGIIRIGKGRVAICVIPSRGEPDDATAGIEVAEHTHTTGDIISGIFSADRIPTLSITKIENLQSELDGKADTDHTHTASDLDPQGNFSSDESAMVFAANNDGTGGKLVGMALSILADVSLSTRATGHILRYVSGTGWVNVPGTDYFAVVGHDHDLVYAPIGHEHNASQITNLQEHVQDIVGGTLVEGSNVTITYDDVAGTITISSVGGGGEHDPVTIVDSASINMILNGQEVSAEAIFGTTAGTVAEGNHNHDGTYTPIGHTHNASQITNLQEHVEDYIAGALVGGANVTISYDDATGTITIAATTGDHNHDADYAALSHEHTYHDLSPDGTVSTADDIVVLAANFTGDGVSLQGVSLNRLSDVALSGLATGDILRHNGSSWVNVPGTDHYSPATHTHAAGDVTSGTFTEARIPNLNASKITAGTIDIARIPDIGIAKVTGLQSALDGKSDTGHGHTYQDLSPDGVVSSADSVVVLAANFTGDGVVMSGVSLHRLSDVQLDNPTDGNVIRHNGTRWVNVPGTDYFAPASHDHAISDVTNLQSELDAKVDESWNVRIAGPSSPSTTTISSTTGDMLTNLAFTAPANSVWQYELVLPRLFMFSGTDGMTFKVILPSGGLNMGVLGTGTSQDDIEHTFLTSSDTLAVNPFVAAEFLAGQVRIEGVIRIGATGGTVTPAAAVITSGDEAWVYEPFAHLRADRVS